MKFFKKKITKTLSVFLTFLFLNQIFFPTVAMALTSGPTQPEVQGFTPIEMTDMVDLFSGDFSYNIPLLDVGGYPINISYSGNIGMDQEASWVGLGWNINPGVINRSVRGVPDDFDGEEVTRRFNTKKHIVGGVNTGVSFELVGYDKLGLGVTLGLSYSNMTGTSFEWGVSPTITLAKFGKGTLDADLGLSSSNTGGLTLSPSVSYNEKMKDSQGKDVVTNSLSGSLAYNTREGLKTMSLDAYSKDGDPNATEGQSLAIGSSYSFAQPTHIIRPQMPILNTAISFNSTLGLEFYATHPNTKGGGYFSTQLIYAKEKGYHAYGYLYEQNSVADNPHVLNPFGFIKRNKEKVILDFNRENDVALTDDVPFLPLTNHTYDVYSVSGQGISGVYRPFRNDIGTVHDTYVKSLAAVNASLGGEFGTANAVHVGAKINATFNTNESGKWENTSGLEFENFNQDKPLQEIVYFKQAGELVVDKEYSTFENIGSHNPTRLKINQWDSSHKGIVEDALETKTESGIHSTQISTTTKEQRQARNQNITFLTSDKARKFGVEKKIPRYAVNNFNLGDNGYECSYLSERDSAGMSQPHHISEITTLKPDGTRYVFGMPVYNTFQSEMSFAVDAADDDDKRNRLVTYDSKDASIKNNEYFDETVTPPFAHSYMLSAVLSPDYEDVTLNGLTPDDVGTYAKFNYTRVHNDYKWRTPYEKDKANYAQNFLTVDSDDRASLVYGKKEVVYIHSIETKTHVAEFEIEYRDDNIEADGKNGGQGDNKLYRLKEIRLYSREDKLNNENPTPIKTVHFEYSYSLCKGVPNSDASGKLTLEKIYFTFGDTHKGRLNPYTFNYSNSPEYDKMSSDRWGTYKLNNSALSNSEFPYSEQNPEAANSNASAWALTEITMPSGGKISVEYESDNYAYVQDKRAMRMFMVKGAGDSKDFSTNNSLYSNGLDPYEFLYFELDDKAQSSGDIEYYKRDLVGNKMFFRFYLNLDEAVNKSEYEYVSGYVTVRDVGVCENNSENDSDYGYVQIKLTGTKFEKTGDNANPISKTGWQFTQLYLPHISYKGTSDPDKFEPFALITAILGSFDNLLTVFKGGVNSDHKIGKKSKEFNTKKSWIRLYEPTGYKYGGGQRVKKIRISDEWSEMITDNTTREYGQEYDYTINESGRTISSGVAAYEPLIGGEENPWRMPVTENQELIYAPDKYIEGPIGQSFFPAPSVGYSQVTVRSISPENVTKHGTGYTINKFYTAKDFPTITKHIEIDRSPKPSLVSNIGGIMSVLNTEYVVASQGYSIELNDMHGKPHKTEIYQQNGTLISDLEYKYKVDSKGDLSNEVMTVNKDGTLSSEMVGIEYDIISDARFSDSKSESIGVELNADGFILGILPGLLPSAYPAYSKEETGFRSIVLTKVINRYGILDEVIATDVGSVVSTKNLLYDAETGEVLLTQTINQNEDHVYNFTYPAHWAYTEMEGSYKNAGVIFSNKKVDDIKEHLVEGDELGVINAENESRRLWVEVASASHIKLIDRSGEQVSSAIDYTSIIVLRSGRRNMQAVSIGSVTTLDNPMRDSDGNGTFDNLVFSNVLNASAVEYADYWKRYCECKIDYSQEIYNPFLYGVKGKMRPVRSHVYLTERTQTNIAGTTNIKKDGVYKTFSTFWNPNRGNNWSIDTAGWQFAQQITEFNPHGLELENKDALQRYSAALYGYRDIVNTAVANNARLREIAFDSFEDYFTSDKCEDEYFSFRSLIDNVTSEKSHTGKYSLKLESGENASVRSVIEPCE